MLRNIFTDVMNNSQKEIKAKSGRKEFNLDSVQTCQNVLDRNVYTAQEDN